MKKIERIVVHHSASGLSATLADVRRWHKKRGFTDVGYHYVIEALGAVRVGREIPETGAHVKGMNGTSVGICVIGDNTVPDREWTSLQRDSLCALVRALLTVWPGAKAVGHRDVANTLCPGTDVPLLIGTGRFE